MKGALACAVALAAAQASALEGVCRFAQECYEAESYGESGYTLEIAPGAGEFTARLEDDSGGIGADLSLTAEGGTILIARDETGVRLLTLAPGGAARYTLHLAGGPLVVSYLGSCETR